MEVPEPITVRCSALVQRDQRVLLCHRNHDDTWVVPGGSPHRDEGAGACAEREVFQEAGLRVQAGEVALVLDVTSPKGEEHLFEIVFAAYEIDPSEAPHGHEDGLDPSFVRLDALPNLALRPHIGDQIRALLVGADVAPTAAYLGNVWEPMREPSRP